MKKTLVILFVCFIPLASFAQNVEFKPYGFLKGDMVYATKGVYSWGNPGNSYLSAPQFASGVDYPALGLTAQHTRFGFIISKDGDIKVGGKLELDFYGGGFDANGKPRIRQAYASVGKGNFELLVGQQWDIYSPVNASTNNTNGNMWYAGNRGFRRAQVKILYKLPANSLLQLSVGETTKEAAGLGADNKAAMPMLQGRLSTKLAKKYGLGAYFVYAAHRPQADNTDMDFNTNGFGADITLPLHKLFAVKGEVNYGTNLNNANLFTAVGSGKKDDDRCSLGAWVNVTSTLSTHFQVVAGFGMDQNRSDIIPAGAIERNTVVYGDLVFPIVNGYSLAVEVMNISTTIKDGATNSAMVFNFSGKVTF